MFDNYRLTTSDLEDPNLPPEFKNSAIAAEVARRDKIIESADIDKRVLPGFKKELRNALVGSDLDKGLDASYEGALYHAESKFREELIKTGNFQASYDKILTEIQDGTGDFTVTGYGERGSKMLVHTLKSLHHILKRTLRNQKMTLLP